ncbi:MAG: hypothetical protein IKE01_04915 [Clostridia bacterium]|nr:hypothetical protein [Clostridia bacterium]
MKLSELYTALQERYPIVQEEKLAAERERREELKNEITRLINLCTQAIEDSKEKLYEAYVNAREKQEELQNEHAEDCKRNPYMAQIRFDICHDYIDCHLDIAEYNYIGSTHVYIGRYFFTLDRINRKHVKSDIEGRLASILTSYCVDHCTIKFTSDVTFYLINNEISVYILAKHDCTGFFSKKECAAVEKFISDVKEMFPNSKEISKPETNEHEKWLTITLDCSEMDIFSNWQSAKNSEDNSNTAKQSMEENELFEMSIDDLGLSPRPLNCLKRRNISTVGELVQLSAEEVKNTEMIGAKSFSEIEQRLEELGITLKS